MGFLGDVISTAIGNKIANHRIERELELQRKRDEQYEEKRKYEENRRRSEEAHQSQVEWQRIYELNKIRRRNGEPELPYPTRKY